MGGQQNGSVAVSTRPSWLFGAWNQLRAWQAARARRIIVRHGDLMSNRDFPPHGANARNASATWNAVLRGTTCEASFGAGGS